MPTLQDDTRPTFGTYSSPPCYMHEFAADAPLPRTEEWGDVARWRKAERQRLLAQRLALSSTDREARSARIAATLDRKIGKVSGRIIGAYWPIRGEPDLRLWAARVMERGGRIALPVVIKKAWPLEYRLWMPGAPLERGVWNIPVPASGTAVQPDIVIAPVVGHDGDHFRLGYGGGFFDRTLASHRLKPLAIGVGYAVSRIGTIYPQPHDIPMDTIVTDQEA